jgi:hypothetical protein
MNCLSQSAPKVQDFQTLHLQAAGRRKMNGDGRMRVTTTCMNLPMIQSLKAQLVANTTVLLLLLFDLPHHQGSA